MRRRSAIVALFAVLLHAFAPLLAGAAPADAASRVELCTAHGTVTIEVPAGGAPSNAAEHCPDCAFHGALASPARAALAPPPAAAAARAFAPQPLSFPQARTASRPRAPPIAS